MTALIVSCVQISAQFLLGTIWDTIQLRLHSFSTVPRLLVWETSGSRWLMRWPAWGGEDIWRLSHEVTANHRTVSEACDQSEQSPVQCPGDHQWWWQVMMMVTPPPLTWLTIGFCQNFGKLLSTLSGQATSDRLGWHLGMVTLWPKSPLHWSAAWCSDL